MDDKRIESEKGEGDFQSNKVNGKVFYILETWESYQDVSGVGSTVSQPVPAKQWYEGCMKGVVSGRPPAGVSDGVLVTKNGDRISVAFVGPGKFKAAK